MPHSRDIEMHVEEESIKEKSLNDLFNVLKDGCPQAPWSARNLPKSFFSYPSANNTLQNSSVESLNRMTPSTGSGPILSPSQSGKTYPPEPYTPGCLSNVPSHIHHSKTHSSPARLQASLAAGAKMVNAEHARHVSDLSTNYPVNHVAPSMGHFHHSTDPLCYRNNGQHLMHSHTSLPQHQQQQPSPKESQVVLNYQYSSLPDGWQLAMHGNGSVYFIDHNNQQTSWYDPRIPENFQSWGMTVEQLEECHIRYMKHVQQQQQQHHQHHQNQQQQHHPHHQPHAKHQLDSHLMEQFQAVNLASHPSVGGYTPPGGAAACPSTPGAAGPQGGAFSPAPAPPPHPLHGAPPAPSTACCFPATAANQPTGAASQHVHPGHAAAVHPSSSRHTAMDDEFLLSELQPTIQPDMFPKEMFDTLLQGDPNWPTSAPAMK